MGKVQELFRRTINSFTLLGWIKKLSKVKKKYISNWKKVSTALLNYTSMRLKSSLNLSQKLNSFENHERTKNIFNIYSRYFEALQPRLSSSSFTDWFYRRKWCWEINHCRFNPDNIYLLRKIYQIWHRWFHERKEGNPETSV